MVKEPTLGEKLEMAETIYGWRYGLLVLTGLGTFLAAASAGKTDKFAIFVVAVVSTILCATMCFVAFYFGKVGRNTREELRRASKSSPKV